MDSQEFEDVTKWISRLQHFEPKIIYLNTDSEVTRIGLLESIVNELGIVKFPVYSSKYNDLSKTDVKIIVNQKMGSDINAGRDVKFESNEQNVNFNDGDLKSLINFYLDKNVNELLHPFLNDFSKITGDKPILLLCRFRGRGISDLDDKFKYWFQDHFLRKAKEHKIKVIVMCEQNAIGIADWFEYEDRDCLKELELNEILPVSKQYLGDKDGFFCKGIVNEENKVEYKEFKFKLQKNMLS